MSCCFFEPILVHGDEIGQTTGNASGKAGHQGGVRLCLLPVMGAVQLQ